jgi:putative addiction module antidote
MFIKLKVKRIGKSLGLILPKAVAARLNVREGDSLFLTDGTDDSFRISAGNPGVARQMESAERVIKRYSDTFRALAR